MTSETLQAAARSTTRARRAAAKGAVAPVAAGPEPSASLAIIRSKVQTPSPPGPVLERPRLLRWLERHRTERVVLVTAEAGFGKTTLLADHSSHSAARCLWYRTETSDRDWVTFLSYMVAAVRESEARFGQETEALLRHVADIGPSRDVVLASFLSELSVLGGQQTILILDDVHHVDNSEDVHEILRRLFEHSPASVQFVLASRRRPDMPLGRIAAHGRLAELGTDDLRFTSTEIDELFRSVYRQPLDVDARRIVEERTEGWAASLQLVSASIAASRPSQVAAFIQALSGAQRPIYDFLAEEVMSRLASATQRVLTAASLLEQVTPPLVAAALSATGAPMTAEDVIIGLREAESLGLVTRRQTASGEMRFHPLLRQFLERQLEQALSAADVKAMHRAVASAAEGSDWLEAGRHYALARESAEAMRVLGAAAYQALGTGTWGAAAEIIDSIPDATPPPAVQVLRARTLSSEGQPIAALRLLCDLDPSMLPPAEQALVRLARASAMQMTGNAEGLWTEVQQLAAIPHLDKVTRGLAHAWHLLLCACRGGNITEARVAVEDLATRAGEATLRHFEHVALHNAATAALAQADYVSAYEHARQANATLVPAASSQRDTSSSTLMTQAVAACELGRVGDGIALVKLALGDSSAPSDALADACYLSAVTGDFERAAALEHQLSGVLNRGPAMFGAVAQASHARIARLLTLGDFERAHLLAVGLSGSCEEVDSAARDSYLLALTSVLLETPDAAERVAEALAACRTQEAWRWQLRAEIVASVQGADTEAIRQAVTQAATSSHLALLETADTVGTALHLLEPVPKQVRESIAHYPGRWRPVLTRQINSPRTPAADTAARLLSEFGSLEDAPIIAEYERQSAVGRRTLSLSRGLLKRVSPTLRIHDLGRTVFEVAGRQLLPSDTRRKAASLPVFLITRPRQTATREQLMEALWPDQDPCAATNSLHQTLHYVRRAIAPWRQTGLGADYIAMDAEVVFLDPELVQVDSVAFMRQATEVLSAGSAARRGAGLMRLYVGGFAPEYEYEEWTLDWRNLVHTTFLHLAHRTAVLLMEHLRPSEAVEVLSHAVSVDGQALELHALLVRALDLTGAKDAARQQYRFYATAVRRELGIEPPPMGELLEGGEDPVD